MFRHLVHLGSIKASEADSSSRYFYRVAVDHKGFAGDGVADPLLEQALEEQEDGRKDKDGEDGKEFHGQGSLAKRSGGVLAPDDFPADLNNLRPDRRFTRDSFSRASSAVPRKSLIFLDHVSAALPATSDNAQTVYFGASMPSKGSKPSPKT